jgi:hypothetical protein
MISLRPAPVVIVALVAVIVGMAILQYRGSNTGEAISPAHKKTTDSLATTKPAFDAHKDSVLAQVARDTVEVARYVKESADAERRAGDAGRRADSLAELNSNWQAAYEQRTEQVVDLKVSLAKKDSAWKDERSARLRVEGLYGADTTRRIALERLADGLRKDLAAAERPCRIVGPIPCPNRRTSAVGGLLLGGIASRMAQN